MRRALLMLLLLPRCGPDTVQAEPFDSGVRPDLALPIDAGAADAARGDAVRSDAAGADVGAADRAALDVASSGDAWPPGPALQRLINFQPPGNPPSGAEADTGLTFSGLRGYGWSVDLSGETDRVDLNPDDLLDTYIAAGAAGRVDTWELIVPEALYLVTVAAGRPDLATDPVRVVAEGVPLFDAEVALRNHYLWSVDRLIGVRDGRLTLEVGTGVSPSVLNFVQVESAFPEGGCTARAEVCNGEDDDCDQGVDEEGVCTRTPVCYASSLESSSAVAEAGFMLRGGNFAAGGLEIDAPGTRVERTLQGNFYRGTLEVEAMGLLWQLPAGGAACARTVFDLNHSTSSDPRRTRLVLSNLAPDCGGGEGGVLRVTMHSAFCCLDGPLLSAADDAAWHLLKVTWSEAEVALFVDGAEVARGAYHGPSVGRDPQLWFGSGGGAGDVTGAVFRNLEICNEVQ